MIIKVLMQWHDSAIVINVSDYDDKSFIVSCLTEQYGLRSGIVTKKKHSNTHIMLGNKVNIQWTGRLESHLGRLNIDQYTSVYPHIHHNYIKLSALLSICALVSITLVEKEPQENLYIKLFRFLDELSTSEQTWMVTLVKIELQLLFVAGFGLDLKKCTVTETTQDLHYISPKTGKAVCREVGLPYHDKLFLMPRMFQKYHDQITYKEIFHSFNVLTFFLQKNILPLKNTTMPSYRNAFLAQLDQQLLET